MSEIIHQARGWSAHFKPKPSGLFKLPGDGPDTARALHALSAAGMLPVNPVAEDWMPPIGDDPAPWKVIKAPCPRCGRITLAGMEYSTGKRAYSPPEVCSRCRVEWISAQAAWGQAVDLTGAKDGMAAADAEIGNRLARFLARLRVAKRKAGE